MAIKDKKCMIEAWVRSSQTHDGYGSGGNVLAKRIYFVGCVDHLMRIDL